MAKKDIVDVGSVVFVYDQNRRERDEKGNVIEHAKYRPTRIVRGTPYSWYLDDSWGKIPRGEEHGLVRKLPAGNYSPYTVYMTEQARDDEQFLQGNRHRIARAVDMVRDVALLRQVAALIGYDETTRE